MNRAPGEGADGPPPRAVVALLGIEDTPTDGVEDYTRLLAASVRARGVPFIVERLPLERDGWAGARRRARALVRAHPGAWFVPQYTALQWSPRALPVRFPSLLRLIRQEGGRAAVVLHDIRPYSGDRLVARARRAIQRNAMRRAARAAERIFLALPPDRSDWMPHDTLPRASFLPVGSNLPPAPSSHAAPRPPHLARPDGRPRVGVFGVTGLNARHEVDDVVDALARASSEVGPIDLVVYGRGSDVAEELLAGRLPQGVSARVRGLLTAEEARRETLDLDAFLFVRHHLSAQRGSAMAAIACGVPVVAYAGRDTAPPLTEWGIRFVKERDTVALARELADVLRDEKLWRQLHDANVRATKEWLDWDRIAARFLEALR